MRARATPPKSTPMPSRILVTKLAIAVWPSIYKVQNQPHAHRGRGNCIFVYKEAATYKKRILEMPNRYSLCFAALNIVYLYCITDVSTLCEYCNSNKRETWLRLDYEIKTFQQVCEIKDNKLDLWDKRPVSWNIVSPSKTIQGMNKSIPQMECRYRVSLLKLKLDIYKTQPVNAIGIYGVNV